MFNIRHHLHQLIFKVQQRQKRKSAPSQIQAYLESHSTHKLHIGAGPTLLDGWLNTTLVPLKEGSVHLDATRPYPMPDACMDYVFSEHMIEHVTFPDAQAMLRECFRVLKPGGIIRLSTPDLERVRDLYSLNPSPEATTYLRWITDRFIKVKDGYNPALVINNFFHGWGHEFIYDLATMRFALERVGFVDVRRYRPGISEEETLQGIEQHGKVTQNEEMNQFESLVVEARKP